MFSLFFFGCNFFFANINHHNVTLISSVSEYNNRNGQIGLELNGQKYCKVHKILETITWRCTRKWCNARFQMDVNHGFLKMIRESHSHLVIGIDSFPLQKEEKVEMLKCIIQTNSRGGSQLTNDGYNLL